MSADVEYVTRCLECGADETDDPGVVVTKHEIEEPNPRRTLTQQEPTTYECEACGAASHNQTGVVPSGDSFDTTTVPADEDRMEIRVNGERIQYRKAEALVVETELFDRTGLTTAGRMRQVRIWAFKPPTFTKGSAHRVELGDYLDERMLLTGIHYYTSDDPWRRLGFSRKLDNGLIDKVAGLSGGGLGD